MKQKLTYDEQAELLTLEDDILPGLTRELGLLAGPDYEPRLNPDHEYRERDIEFIERDIAWVECQINRIKAKEGKAAPFAVPEGGYFESLWKLLRPGNDE